MPLFATTAAGLEPVLARELRALGAREIEPVLRGVAFRGDRRLLYRANLWLRTAHRLLLPIAEFPAGDRAQLYEGVHALDWSEHLTLDRTLAVDAVSHRSKLDHTQFVSRVVKDAVVDWFRERTGRRPSVDARDPDVALNARLSGDHCTLSVDASGPRMHRRGYRPSFGVQAPLKETLAAGVLLLGGYDGTGPLVDPFCGSGTLLVEAALIATNTAPGLLGRPFGLQRHPAFDPPLFDEVRQEARAAVREVEGCPISGSDVSETAVRAAVAAVRGAGVDDIVRIRRADIGELGARGEGRLVTNPPYGERLGEMQELAELYRRFGDALKQRCRGMTAHVLTGSRYLAGRIGLHPSGRDVLWNGPIECRLLHFELY
jgi:putative N6-adenine-specific DNA methylase